MMEGFIALLFKSMPVSEVADTLDEHDTQLWRLISELVERAHKGEDWSKVRRVLVDETSSKRGHRYVTCFVDAESRRLLFLTEGKGSDTVEAFARELEARRGFRDQIELVCMDMSGAFAKGVTRSLPKARVAYDHFHIMQMAGKAVDEVRKDLRSRGAALKGALWALRGNVWNQSAERLAQRAAYCQQYPRLGSSIMLRETLQDVLADRDEESLRWWCQRAMRSRLEPFKKLVRTLRTHWDGVCAFMDTRITNGLIEAINGKLQLAKRLARGYRSLRNFRTMAYLKAGALTVDIPALKPTKTHTI